MGVHGNQREIVQQMDCDPKTRCVYVGVGRALSSRQRHLVSRNGLCKERVKGFSKGKGEKGEGS